MALTPSDGWTYVKKIDISDAGSVSADYQMKLTIHKGDGDDNTATGDIYCNNHCLDFHDDIRFGTISDLIYTTQLSQWVESSDANTIVLWVKCPTDGSNTFYMFIGRATTDVYSDGDATFLFFDDFEDGVGDWSIERNGVFTQESTPAKFNDYISKFELSAAQGGVFRSTGSVSATTSVILYVRKETNTKAMDIVLGDIFNAAGGPDWGKAASQIGFQDSGVIEYYDGAWHILQAYSADTWYKIELNNFDFTADTYDIYIDDILKKSGAGFRADTIINQISWRASLDTGQIQYTDFVSVRKWSDTPPTWDTFGSWVYIAPPPVSLIISRDIHVGGI